MAHGGVAYLAADGRTRNSEPVTKLCFYGVDNPRSPKEMRFLRIGTAEFRKFLRSWTRWLNKSLLLEQLSEGAA
jgi:hypothetical protein